MASFWNKLWLNQTTSVPSKYKWDKTRARNYVLAYLDRQGFDTQVFLVSASGFFTDSYALSATNIILPSLAYIYWPSSSSNQPQLVINCVTLLGSVCGQALFGYLADRYGRRKLYGVELVVVIFGTLGMAQVSTGANKSMSVLWWIIFWRFNLGLGIGAEYPLSAVITAEFASTEYRATMMACVFLMQPLGQFCAATVGWAVLTSLVKSRGLDMLPIHGAELSDQHKFDIISTIDSVWRCVVAVGTIPALFAIVYRLSIPESPRYTMDVLDNERGAFYDSRLHRNLKTTEEDVLLEIGVEIPVEDPPPPDNPPGPPPLVRHEPGTESSSGGQISTNSVTAAPTHPAQANPTSANPAPADPAQQPYHQGQSGARNYFTREELEQYFINEGNWMWLAATSACWFLLDFAFYGLGIDNPRRIAAIWAASQPNDTDFQYSIHNWPSDFDIGNSSTAFSNASFPDWENPFDVETNIYRELYGNAFRYVITISLGSLVGSAVMILLINKLPRKGWLITSFLILAILFLVMGASLQAVEFHPSHWLTVLFYIVCQFFFNWGPNTLTFIIPAEIFPTRYRCTCHGISAACGKLGSLAVQGVLSRQEFTHHPTRVGIVLGCFSIPMTLGAIFAWGWLPNLQERPRAATRTCELPTLPSKTLETLAEGRRYAAGPLDVYPEDHELAGRLRGGKEVLGFEGKLSEVRKRFRRSRNRPSGYPSPVGSAGEGPVVGHGGDVEMAVMTSANGHVTAIGSDPNSSPSGVGPGPAETV